MKTIYKLFLLFFVTCTIASKAQQKTGLQKREELSSVYLIPTYQLSSAAAELLTKSALNKAETLKVTATIVILDGSGNVISMLRGNGVGPHNTEAARRKAYTALSTKTPTLALMRMAENSADAKNLNTLPELLLLSGGAPLYFKGEVIGSIGVAGGGSAENDDAIAKAASISTIGISTIK